MASYKASARLLDEAYGEILTALESSGAAANTLVICTTDHGIAFPGMKCNLTAHGTGVSLIMRGPAGFSGGKTSNALVSQLDLYPTICELANVEKPQWLQGRSLMPLIRGEAQEINQEIFAEVNYHAAYEPKRAVRTSRYNYIRHFGERRHPVLPNCDDSPSKDVWLKNGWRDHVVPRELLFDTVFDPNETRNLIDDPVHAKIAAEMRGRLDSWMQRTRDPLLHGPVKAPAGAVVNDPDAISPKEKTQPA
jgi:N-sulfoglucosamine sulfohydrolase